MRAGTRRKKVLQARALYAEGLTQAEIAAAIGVATGTVSHWASHDRRNGDPWVRGPRQFNPPPNATLADRLYARLQERLERLIGGTEDDPELEDRALKVCRLLEHLRADRDNLNAQLGAMHAFASFCLQTLPEEEMAPVRRAIRMFVDQLRKEHA